MNLSIAENFRGIFYIPFYILRELSLDAKAGLSVDWLPPGLPGAAIDDVKAGKIDLTWGGPMRVMIDHDTSPNDEHRLVSVSQAVGRDPFCLLTRQPDIELQNLPQCRMSVVTEVPTPWLCLQADLADKGIAQPSDLRRDLDMPSQFAALARGEVDVIQAFEPFVSQAIRQGNAHLLYEASSRGPTVYTAFITSRQTLASRHKEIGALDTALGQALRWIHQAPAVEVADRVAKYFPDLTSIDLQDSIDRYTKAEVWSHTTHLNKAGFHRLSDSFFRSGAIAAPAIYDHCVFNFGEI